VEVGVAVEAVVEVVSAAALAVAVELAAVELAAAEELAVAAVLAVVVRPPRLLWAVAVHFAAFGVVLLAQASFRQVCTIWVESKDFLGDYSLAAGCMAVEVRL
jgi:uncharacterized membrane protein (UPF0182 family)